MTLPHMHPNVVLFLLVAAVLWLAARGRLSNLIAAMEGKNGGTPLTPSAAGTPGNPTTGKPGSYAFGLTDVTSSHVAPADMWQGPNAPDRGLLPDEYSEWNYMVPPGSHESVFLPDGGVGWHLGPKKQGYQAGLGGWEDWQGPGGAEIVFLHLSDLWDQSAGTGGVVGTTGWNTDPQFGAGGAYGPSNAHLAVIYNQAAQHYITGG